MTNTDNNNDSVFLSESQCDSILYHVSSDTLQDSFDNTKESEYHNDESYNGIRENELDEDYVDELVSNLQILLDLIKKYTQAIFKDQFGQLFASVKVDDHYETMSLDSSKFDLYLLKIWLQSKSMTLKNSKKHSELPSKETRSKVIEYLKAEAEFNRIIKSLDIRVAKTDDFIFYYDVSNHDWSAIKITPDGWSIDNNPPILFKRYKNQQSQCIPVLPENLLNNINRIENDNDYFKPFMRLLNLKNNDQDNELLLKVYIISLFIPDIPKPILIPHGEQGSAKSTMMELIKMLVDPCIAKTLTFPRDNNELIQQLSHNYVSYYDNVSHMPDWRSDQLCRAVTGSGYSKRILYSDDDDIIYNIKRCIGFNGINIIATKADLLDRAITIQLERIPKEKRKKIQEIWNEFDKIKPELLGYIFSILSKVLKVKKNGGIVLSCGLNRMADFEEYGEIISRCMGYQDTEFLRVYQENIGVQIDEAIDSSLLSQSILKLIEIKGEFEGTATLLLMELLSIIEKELKIINKSVMKSFPTSANLLSRRINEVKTNLREKEIDIERIKNSKGERIIKIWKTSPLSPYRQQL